MGIVHENLELLAGDRGAGQLDKYFTYLSHAVS
jgi:hypothetical protein